MQYALVTGAGGFIGSHVVDALVGAGKDVMAFDVPGARLHRGDVPLIMGTIDDVNALTAAFAGQEAIFHLAAVSNVNHAFNDPLACVRTNILGTANVLEAARRAGVARVIFASTVWVYNAAPADAPEPLTETTPLSANATMLLSDWSHLYGIPYTVLRYGIPYGPRMRDELVIAKFLGKALRGEPLTVGHASRHFLYVSDLARAHVLALGEVAKNQTYNLEGPETITIRQVADAVRELVGNDVTIEEQSGRPGDYRDRLISAAKAKRDLGWEPVVPFAEGMRYTYDWFRAQRRAAEPQMAVAAGT